MGAGGGWDVHTHLVPQAIVDLAQQNGAFGMSLQPGRLCVCGYRVPLHPICEPVKLVERIASDRLDGAIVSVPPPLFRPDLGADTRRRYAETINTALLETCSAHRDVLRPLAYLPAEDPETATAIAASLGDNWAGVVIGTEIAPRSYADAVYHPLWVVLERANLPVFVHPGASPDTRLAPFYLGNLLGNPVETTVVAAQLIFGDVLSVFPQLKFILAHGGGAVAALAGRWQRGLETKRPGVPHLKLPPTEAVRCLYVDSLVHSQAATRLLLDVLGEGQVLLGSDWPFPMGSDGAEANLACLPPTTAERVRRANAVAVFGRRLAWPADP